jgi:hypothetical protein
MYTQKEVTIHVLLVSMYLLLQLLFVNKVPDIMVDEAWYANTAYNFSIGNGIINTSPGSQGGDIFIVYTILLGSFFKLFGCSLLVTRFLSIVGGIAALLGFMQILKLLRIKTLWFVIISLVFTFSNVFYVIFRSGRPDGLIIAFGLWSLYFALKYYQVEKPKFILISSILGCLATGVHPHGFLFMAAAGIFFIFISIEKKQWKPVWTYAWISGILMIILIIGTYLVIGDRAKDIIWQFRDRNTFGNDQSILSSFVTFFRDYTLGNKRLYIFLFEIAVVLSSLFFIKKENLYFKAFVTSAIFVITFSFAFFNPYPLRHFGEFVVFSLIILAMLLNSSTGWLYKVLFLGTSIYFLNSIAGDIYIIYKKSKNESYDAISKEINNAVPDKTVTVSLLEFWYPLKENKNYNQYTRWKKTPYKDFNELIATNTIQYAVLSDYMVTNKTGTSGRPKTIPEKDRIFYTRINELVTKKGILQKELHTKNYGLIRIWKIRE